MRVHYPRQSARAKAQAFQGDRQVNHVAGRTPAGLVVGGLGPTVAMVGDGVNDAPAFAQADIGLALGSGTEIGMRAAPAVVMSGNLTRALETFAFARATLRVVRQNLFRALFQQQGMDYAGGVGLLHPIFAAAMVVSSFPLILNSTRGLTTLKH